MDTRYNFTAQFLLASEQFAREASAIERIAIIEVRDVDRVRHRGYIVGAIMQSTAALEAEIWEVMVYGPGHHLGSDRTDSVAAEFLRPISGLIDRQDALTRYKTVLHVLGKTPIEFDASIPQNVALVVKLRNEIVHYKSKWGANLDRIHLLEALKQKAHRPPPFEPATTNFFPHRCLSAECAGWAVDSCVRFLELFYERLGVPSPLRAYADRLGI